MSFTGSNVVDKQIRAAEISAYSRTQLCRCLLLAAHDLAVIHWICPLELHLRLALLRVALDLQLSLHPVQMHHRCQNHHTAVIPYNHF